MVSATAEPPLPLPSPLQKGTPEPPFFNPSGPVTHLQSFSFTIGDANYLDETEHYYVYFPDLNITWLEAKTAAENASPYYGLEGYLATITSEAENQIAAVQVNDFGWIGGSDLEIENDLSFAGAGLVLENLTS